MRLQDKVIVVTGGGDGIGRAICQRFARESPAALIVSDINFETARTVADDVSGHAMACDVADERQVEQLVEFAEDTFGRIDLFCANAGIATSGGAEAPNDVWQRTMDVNFMSHVYSTRAVLPAMLRRGEGYLLHTVSAAGLLTQTGSAPYAVSKHAALALAEWLAISHGDQGIRVSCLCPMGVWTNMLKSEAPSVKALHASAISPNEVADAVVAGIASEDFLILPHPEVEQFFQHKAEHYDRWLAGMRKRVAEQGTESSGPHVDE